MSDTKTNTEAGAHDGDSSSSELLVDEVFPLPWSYDCPRGKESTVYDADSCMVCFISGNDAQTRAAVIVEAVNSYWLNPVTLND
jgi:hypothetical protein